MRRRVFLALLAILLPLRALDADPPPPTFGTTVVVPGGLKGAIYYIQRNSTRLPDFERLKPVGTIYTSELNVPSQAFERGFPGVTDRFEWFAIDYSGKFWISKPGLYTFLLNSDDGSRLYIDDQLLIDNDGTHPPEEKTGVVFLKSGIHSLRVPYFQGPRFLVALVLRIAGPGEPPRVFSTEEFRPPSNPEAWNDEDARETLPARPQAPAELQRRLGDWADEYVRNLSPARHFRGTIAAEVEGQAALTKSYGLAVEEWQIPNSARTRFEIASVSKQFTAAAILQLADNGKLSVEDPVGKFYPDAPPAWKSITIHHLLTHTSGLPESGFEHFYKGRCAPYTTEEQVKTFRDRALNFQPGTAWKYSNTGYYLLAFIIEKVSGESYAEYLAHHIFEPLKMSQSGFAAMPDIVPLMAEGYTHDGPHLKRREYFDRSMETGAGGIYSTVEDLLRWNNALNSPGLLSARALESMFAAHPPGNYGYGWFVETSPRRKIYHEGGDPGFAAFEARYPDQHVVILVLANEDDAPVRDFADALAKHLFDE